MATHMGRVGIIEGSAGRHFRMGDQTCECLKTSSRLFAGIA